jgi:uncharacterized membrane protein (UPF0127 family)
MTVQEVAIGRKRFTVEVVTERSEIQKGLGGRESLPRNRGMLLVLPTAGWSVNMNDMKFDLDVAFLDRKAVINELITLEKGVDKEVSPISKDTRYILKMPAKWFETNNLGVNSQVDYVIRTPMWMVYEVVASLPPPEEEDSNEG